MKNVLPLVLALALAACAAPASRTGSESAAVTAETAAVTVGQLFTVPRTCGTSLGWNTGTAYYELALSAADYDRSALVLKTDYASGTQTPVCSVPGCTHASDSCPAWLPDWERHSLLVLGDAVYLLYCGFSPSDRELLYGRPWEEYWDASYRSIVDGGALPTISDLDAYRESLRADYELGRSPSYLDKISPDGTSRSRVFTLPEERNWIEVDFQWCDGTALYGIWVDPYLQQASALVRLDLADGTVEDCPLLDNEQVLGVEGSRFLTLRYVSDEPLDPLADPEIYNAWMQNATVEFSLLTFPTGERQTLFSEPNDLTVYQNGFLGVQDGTLYFQRRNAAGDSLQLAARDLAGGTRVVTDAFPSQDLWVRGGCIDFLQPVGGGTPLQYLVLEGPYSRQLLDLETGTWQEITQQSAEGGAVIPVARTGDGRWMLGLALHTPGFYGRYDYGFLTDGALCSGSTGYDRVTMWP